MPLDPHAKRILSAMAMAPATTVAGLSPQQMRESFNRLAQSLGVRETADLHVRNAELSGPAGVLPIRIYRPCDAGEPSPALVYFHGGGCIFGDIDTHDGICRMLASGSGCIVIAVGYRKAPEHPFPAAVEDSIAATGWVFAHAPELEIDPQRIAVGGDSAGGGLAAVVCQMAAKNGTPPIALQVLLCPVLDMSTVSPSRRALAEGYFLDQATIDWMVRHYCPPGIDLKDPRLSPIFAPDLAGVAPAHIHTAEFDPLCDEGETYAGRLEQAGVAVRYTRHEGMIHHFYGMAAAIPYARSAMTAAAAAIGQALAQGFGQDA